MDAGTPPPRSFAAMNPIDPRRRLRVPSLVAAAAVIAALLLLAAMRQVDASTQLPEPRRTHVDATQALSAVRGVLLAEPSPSPQDP